MTWTDEKPKEPGYYWFRWDSTDKHPAVTEVVDNRAHGLIAPDYGYVNDLGGQWAGPIPEPTDPT